MKTVLSPSVLLLLSTVAAPAAAQDANNSAPAAAAPICTDRPTKANLACTAPGADVAIAYLLRPTLQLDLGANFGLNRLTPDEQVYVGLSTRF